MLSTLTSKQFPERRKCPSIDKYTKGALYVAIFCGLYLSFKFIEPTVFPVVKDFKIVDVIKEDSNLIITGTFDQVRDCEFISVIGYSGNKFIRVKPNYSNSAFVSRLVRIQTYGPWVLTPVVDNLELYAKHSCLTGTVVTRIFNGAIVL